MFSVQISMQYIHQTSPGKVRGRCSYICIYEPGTHYCWVASDVNSVLDLIFIYILHFTYCNDCKCTGRFCDSTIFPVLLLISVLFCTAGIVNRILSWSALVPLSRLTFMAYLVHPAVIFNYYLSRPALIHVDDMQIVSSCSKPLSSPRQAPVQLQLSPCQKAPAKPKSSY